MGLARAKTSGHDHRAADVEERNGDEDYEDRVDDFFGQCFVHGSNMQHGFNVVTIILHLFFVVTAKAHCERVWNAKKETSARAPQAARGRWPDHAIPDPGQPG
jgi:hypothetical protein